MFIYALIVYVIILFVLSAFFTKKSINSYEEYSLCGRTLTITYIFLTYLGTWIGGGTIIGLSSWTYLNGVNKYWVISAPYFMGFFFALLFITRIRKLNQYSIGDMFALRYPRFNELIRIPVTISIVVRNVTMIAMQFSALAFLMTFYFDIDRNLAVLITFLVLTSYTALSGLWGVVITDVFQGILQTIGLALLFYYSIKMSGGFDNVYNYYLMVDKLEFLELIPLNNFWDYIGLYLITLGLFFLIGDQSDWQRINSSKTDKTAFWGFLVPLTIALIWMLIPAYIGIFQRIPLLINVKSEYATYQFIIEMLNPYIASFILSCLFAAIMSSADSFLLSTGVTFSNDIIKRFVNTEAGDKELIFWSRFFVIISGGIGFAFSIIIENIITLWIVGIIINLSSLLMPYLAAWFSKHTTTQGALAGMLAGLLYCCTWLIKLENLSVYQVFWGILINYIVMTAVSIFTCKEDSHTINQTYYWSKNFRNTKNIPS